MLDIIGRNGRHSGLVVSTVTLQLEGPRFNSRGHLGAFLCVSMFSPFSPA